MMMNWNFGLADDDHGCKVHPLVSGFSRGRWQVRANSVTYFSCSDAHVLYFDVKYSMAVP